jgi:flagellar assembly factor FliW
MPQVATKYFGTMSYDEEAIFEFPFGLPGFGDERRFVFIERHEHAPLIFLQSLRLAGLCFLALPLQVVDAHYKLAVSPEDLVALELNPDRQPLLASEILALALISQHDGFSATANLMAPIVVNLRTRRALQAIRRDSLYSHQHAVLAQCAEKGPEQRC